MEVPQRGPGAEARKGVWGRSPPEAETQSLSFTVTNFNDIFEQFYLLRILNIILDLHTGNQEASTGWARPEINDTKTPNWFIIYFLCNIFEFAGIFILKLKI